MTCGVTNNSCKQAVFCIQNEASMMCSGVAHATALNTAWADLRGCRDKSGVQVQVSGHDTEYSMTA